MAVPTLIAVGTGFVDVDGGFTLRHLAALGEPVILASLWSSIWVSGLTAIIGAVVGAVVCYALLGTRQNGPLRSVVDAISGVLAQFGGVMLAFAFVSIIGIQGLITVRLRELGIDIFANGVWLYEVPGLILPYLYFQIPLMVIVFLPALESLKKEWAEANATLGGSGIGYWWRIGFPVLAPSFLGSLLLLFANAFSSYATAAALAGQGQGIVPLQISVALRSETVIGREHVAGALALWMIVVMAVVMTGNALLYRRAARWQR